MHHRLYVVRREHRLYQKDVAKKLRIDPQTYHLKESGKSEFSLSEAIRLTEIFECTLDDLFGNSETAGIAQ